MHQYFATGLFWMCVACAVVAQGFILRSVRGVAHSRVLDVPEGHVAMPRRHDRLEMMWAVLPAVGLIVLLVVTWRAVQRSNEVAPPPMATFSPASPT